jgi:hypothetical protein
MDAELADEEPADGSPEQQRAFRMSVLMRDGAFSGQSSVPSWRFSVVFR